MKSYHLATMCRFIILCTFLFALKQVQGETTNVAKCTRITGSLPINAYVHGCLQPPCILPQLEDVYITVVFKAPYNLHNMKTNVLAFVPIFPLPVPHDLKENAITCNFLTNTYCPVMKDEIVQYTLKMFIESFFPVGLPVTLEFRVDDKDKNTLWCIRLPILIAPPREKIGIN